MNMRACMQILAMMTTCALAPGSAAPVRADDANTNPTRQRGNTPAPARGNDTPQSKPAASEGDRESVQDVMFLSETRPIFIRLRLDAGGKPFRAAWLETVKAIHTYLDRDGDGTLTKDEADRGSLPMMVRSATGGAAALPRADLDSSPKDGKVSLEELAEVLRPALGPFRVQVGRLAIDRNDALFNHLDRNKDGVVSKDELAAAVSSLHRFDLDDDELIDALEMEPFSNPLAASHDDMTRRGKLAAVPPVIELSSGDPSSRPLRLLLKKYDKGTDKTTSESAVAGDNRLSPQEFAIDPKEFASADTDSDGALDTDELRRYLSGVGPDVEMVVKLSGNGSSATTIEAAGAGSKPLPPEVHVAKLSDGDIEIAIGEVSLDFHADGGEHAAENARRYYAGQFQAADKDNNKYLDKNEVKDHGPFASLFDMMDKDGDGKLYMKEVDAFVDQQTQAARSQMVLSVDDQGRAIFAIMDLNRDRHLGIREIRDAATRVSSWDRNGDGQIRSDEIPHHFQLSIGRGQITAVGMNRFVAPGMMAEPDTRAPTAGPKWFRKMDRNRDGDISRREFLGPRADFERLDRDHDGLIDAQEAAKAKP
jgi:Ca2+-binding EF-hand superfamily protein